MRKTFLLTLILLPLLFISSTSSNVVDVITVEKPIYTVKYSQKLEQPLMVKYRSTNRPTNVNRGSMDFYGEPNIHTSNSDDYKSNVWDKGHLAPAATFSDNLENLKTTFSYLNCVLQHQDLNRGEWRLLEEQERKWDDIEPLTVTIDIKFDETCKVLPTGATIPSFFVKHIYFEKSKTYKCYTFLNEKPKFKWSQLETLCKKH